MKYHLDTNVVSELMRGHEGVNARFAAMSRDQAVVSQPALAEIAYGIARLPESKRKRWLQESHASIIAAVQHTEWTDEVSAAYGNIKALLERRGELIGDFDIAIAAHALVADAVLVTADARHLPRIPGLVIEDWSRS